MLLVETTLGHSSQEGYLVLALWREDRVRGEEAELFGAET